MGKGVVIGRTRMQTTVDNYINEVLARFTESTVRITEDITDRVFLMIQKNPQLYREYQDLIATGTSKRGLNARLGKRIRENFCLQNVGRCHNPKSHLIMSYERHAK
jgi:hypothetical protein